MLAYSAPAGVPIYAGRTAPNLPQYILAQPVNTWAKAPLGFTLNDMDPTKVEALNPNFPDPPAYAGAGNFAQTIAAWNGHVDDIWQNKIRTGIAGGHDDWHGNDQYELALNVAVPSWMRIQPPTFVTNDGQETTGRYAIDGRIRSFHNYNKQVALPDGRLFVACQGATSTNGSYGTSNSIMFDVNGNELAFGPQCSSPAAADGGGACLDTSRNAVWWRGRGSGWFAKYDVATNAWANQGSQIGIDGYAALTYVPGLDVIFYTCQAFANKFAIFDPVTNQLHQPPVQGAPIGSVLRGTAQPRWANGALYWWDNDSDTTVINRIMPTGDPRTDAWQIDQQPVAAGNTVTPNARTQWGTYGRFSWFPDLGVFTLINDLFDVYVFRPDWGLPS